MLDFASVKVRYLLQLMTLLWRHILGPQFSAGRGISSWAAEFEHFRVNSRN